MGKSKAKKVGLSKYKQLIRVSAKEVDVVPDSGNLGAAGGPRKPQARLVSHVLHNSKKKKKRRNKRFANFSFVAYSQGGIVPFLV